MQFRHEVKHEISQYDMLVLRHRLRAVMRPDPHAEDGKYLIRSLYFDNTDDKALREKLSGCAEREKYRIRLYNYNTDLIHLERKYKNRSLGYKDSVTLTTDQARAIAAGDLDFPGWQDNDILRTFRQKMLGQGLRAKVIVDYEREPFIFDAGNVRVTLDYHIRTGLTCTDFLNPDCITVPISYDPVILEVKWDNYLPDVIRNAVQLDGRHNGAFSKYAACRMFD